MVLDQVPFPCGGAILVLWGKGSPPGTLKEVVDLLQDRVGLTGRVQVENIDRLILSDHTASTFDGCVSGYVQPTTVVHPKEVLKEVARLLRPGGIFCIQEPALESEDPSSNLRTSESLCSTLKLAGFVEISKPETVTLTDDEAKELKAALKIADVSIVEVQTQKPNYEVGASTQLKLNFPKPVEQPKVSNDAAQVWSLSADDILDDDVDVIDDDDLLDEEDLKKPDPASLKASCDGQPKKRKACKNCTCGLAEELDGNEQKKPTKSKPAQSACGSCYLGDAFRCASCPYLGMPAFKPGEKVQLSDRQLNADQ